MTINDEELHLADIQRAMDASIDSWENDANLTADEMCAQLEAICSVVDGSINYKEFTEATNLVGRLPVH